MSEVNPPLFLPLQQTYQAADLGRAFRDIVGEGVVAGGDMKVTQRGAGANMSVDVAAGVAWVLGDTATDQPPYRIRNDATVNLAVTAANATNPRKDLVVAEVLDSAFTGSSNLWRLRVIAGTPAGSPAVPTLPATAIPLAVLTIAANDTQVNTADIADARRLAQHLLATQAICVMRKSAAQTAIPRNNETVVSLGVVDLDPLGTMGSVAQNRIIIPYTGWWEVKGRMRAAISTTTATFAHLYMNLVDNNNVILAGDDFAWVPVSGAQNLVQEAQRVVYLTAGQTLGMKAWYNDNGSFTTWEIGQGAGLADTGFAVLSAELKQLALT